MAKRASLTDFAARKAPLPGEAPSPAPEPPGMAERPKGPERRGQTLRLIPAAWRQLKLLALDQGKPAHELLVEAVNDLFRKHSKPPIA